MADPIYRIDPITHRLEVIAWDSTWDHIAETANKNTAEELRIAAEAARRQAEHDRYRSTIEERKLSVQ
ncbi:MAG: hypothetical protein K2Y01_09050 [Rhabdochlamydiaceae bacterium]|nr:hypothetical protein [Rhabdochlamydiaceae bacterium]